MNRRNGLLHNTEPFAEYGVAVPTTWDELIGATETFRAAGVPPLHATLADCWTAMPTVNAPAAVVPPEDFFDQLDAERTTFAAAWPEVTAKALELFSYAQPDAFARNYENGNRAFAQGEAAMYVHGNFALPAIAGFDPAFEVGAFARYVDHRIPKAVPLEPMVQQLLIDGDATRFLGELDREYAAVAARR